MIKLKSLITENVAPLVVYHGTGEKFERFSLSKSTQGIIWFTSDKNKILAGEVGAQGKGYIITAEVTINNPAGWDEYDKYMLDQLKHMGYDGAILKNETGYDCFVFDPRQIKIIEVEKNMIKLKSLLNKRPLQESMNLSVGGANYKRFDNLLSICTELLRILDKVYWEMPPDQQAYFKKNRVMELFAPDGDGYDKPTGIINFYTSGFTKESILKLLRLALPKLKSLGLTVGKISRPEQSGTWKSQVIRIPIVKNNNTYGGPPELNLANRNAYHVFKNILGFKPDVEPDDESDNEPDDESDNKPDDESNSSFSFTVDELETAINTIIKNDPDWIKKNQIGQNEIDPENPHNSIGGHFQDMGMKVISGGYSEERIYDVLERALKICAWARKHNLNKLYVG